MQLDIFITETLVSIVKGVANAQGKLHSTGTINPVLKMSPQLRHSKNTGDASPPTAAQLAELGMIPTQHADMYASMIEFDVAITVHSMDETEKTTEKSGEIGAKIYVAEGAVSGANKTSTSMTAGNSQVSRIKFRVPVAHSSR